MNADGKNERRLTDNVAMDGYPAWSPDGKTIAFSSDRIHDGWLAEIWLIDADGSNLRQVTDSPGWATWVRRSLLTAKVSASRPMRLMKSVKSSV